MEPCGLRGDRRWMAIDGDGVCVTARERPQLVRVLARVTGTGLRLEMDDREPFDVGYPDAGSRAAQVWIWGQACRALDAGDVAARWMSDALDKPVRLVAMDDRFKRRPDQDCTLPDDEVSFADCYPVLAIGRSLARRPEHPHPGTCIHAPVPAQLRGGRRCAVRGGRLAAHPHRHGGIRRS